MYKLIVTLMQLILVIFEDKTYSRIFDIEYHNTFTVIEYLSL